MRRPDGEYKNEDARTMIRHAYVKGASQSVELISRQVVVFDDPQNIS